jgi:hypothetical protein
VNITAIDFKDAARLHSNLHDVQNDRLELVDVVISRDPNVDATATGRIFNVRLK